MLSYTKKPSEDITQIFRCQTIARNEFNIQYKWFCQYFEHSMELILLLLRDIEVNKKNTGVESNLQLSFLTEVVDLFFGSYIDLMDKRYSCSFIIYRSILESITRSIWISYNPEEYKSVLPSSNGITIDNSKKRFNFSKFLHDKWVKVDIIFPYLSFHTHWNTVNTAINWGINIWYPNPPAPEVLEQMHIEGSINMMQFLIFITLYFIWENFYKEWIYKNNLDVTLDVFENILIKWWSLVNPQNPFPALIKEFKVLISMNDFS